MAFEIISCLDILYFPMQTLRSVYDERPYYNCGSGALHLWSGRSA